MTLPKSPRSASAPHVALTQEPRASRGPLDVGKADRRASALDRPRRRRLTPEQRAKLIDCIRRGLSPRETVAATGLPRATVWRYRNKSNDGLLPETRIGAGAHRFRRRDQPKSRPKPNVVPGIPYARLVAGK